MTRIAQAAGTKQRLIDEGVRAATRHGLSGLSFGTLATAAGMSKSGMFAHFGSREGLLVCVVDEAERRFRDAVCGGAAGISWRGAGAGRPIVELDGVTRRFIRYSAGLLVDDGAFLSSAVHEAHALEPAARDRVRAFARTWEETLVNGFEAGVAAGELRSELSAERVAFAITGFGLATTWTWQIGGDREAAEARGLADAEATMREIATPAGRQALAS